MKLESVINEVVWVPSKKKVPPFCPPKLLRNKEFWHIRAPFLLTLIKNLEVAKLYRTAVLTILKEDGLYRSRPSVSTDGE